MYFRAFRGCHLLFLPFASFAVNSFGCGYAALCDSWLTILLCVLRASARKNLLFVFSNNLLPI